VRAPETWIMSANRIDADARPPSIDVLAPRVRLVRTPRRVGVRSAQALGNGVGGGERRGGRARTTGLPYVTL
jgi:hypothetical protein